MTNAYEQWHKFTQLANTELDLFVRLAGSEVPHSLDQALELLKLTSSPEALPFILALAQWIRPDFDREIARWCISYLSAGPNALEGNMELLWELTTKMKQVPFTRTLEGKLICSVESDLPDQDCVVGIFTQVEIVVRNRLMQVTIHPTAQLAKFVLALLEEKV